MQTEATKHLFQTNEVRVVFNAKPLFVAVDIAKILDIKNVKAAISALKPYEHGGVYVENHAGVRYELTLITEAGLHALVAKSKSTIIDEFKSWVYSAIINAAPTKPSAVIELEHKLESLQKELVVLAAKANSPELELMKLKIAEINATNEGKKYDNENIILRLELLKAESPRSVNEQLLPTSPAQSSEQLSASEGSDNAKADAEVNVKSEAPSAKGVLKMSPTEWIRMNPPLICESTQGYYNKYKTSVQSPTSVQKFTKWVIAAGYTKLRGKNNYWVK